MLGMKGSRSKIKEKVYDAPKPNQFALVLFPGYKKELCEDVRGTFTILGVFFLDLEVRAYGQRL